MLLTIKNSFQQSQLQQTVFYFFEGFSKMHMKSKQLESVSGNEKKHLDW